MILWIFQQKQQLVHFKHTGKQCASICCIVTILSLVFYARSNIRPTFDNVSLFLHSIKHVAGRGGGEDSCKIRAHTHTDQSAMNICTNFSIQHTARDTLHCILPPSLSLFSACIYEHAHSTETRSYMRSTDSQPDTPTRSTYPRNSL